MCFRTRMLAWLASSLDKRISVLAFSPSTLGSAKIFGRNSYAKLHISTMDPLLCASANFAKFCTKKENKAKIEFSESATLWFFYAAILEALSGLALTQLLSSSSHLGIWDILLNCYNIHKFDTDSSLVEGPSWLNISSKISVYWCSLLNGFC